MQAERETVSGHWFKRGDTDTEKSYLLRNTTTHSKEESPSWEADSRSASKEILYLPWNPNVHYRVHKIATGSHPEPDELSLHH
jgi:hypothetical protein